MSSPYYFHSGVDRPELVSLLDEQGAMGMVNVHVVQQPRLQDALIRYSEVPLFLDSGFRHTMHITRYLRLIEEYGHRFGFIANLDVPFDQKSSDEHYRWILARLSSPALRAKILWVYQGGPLCELTARARDTPLIGIGGCVLRMQHEGIRATLWWLRQVGELLMSAGSTRAHIFGIGNKYLLTRLCHEPWVWGFDSSKWLLAYRANLQLLPSGASIPWRGGSKRECAAKNIRVLEHWIHPCSGVDIYHNMHS